MWLKVDVYFTSNMLVPVAYCVVLCFAPGFLTGNGGGAQVESGEGLQQAVM